MQIPPPLSFIHMLMVSYACTSIVLDELPSTQVTTNKEELMEYFQTMYTMRRMEITCDTEYKV